MALKYPDILESNNPNAYGIVRANQVQGHKTVPTLNDLYQIKDFILSDSENNTNNDAIGQRWYVVDQNRYYQLKDWSKRNQKEGWEEASSNSAELYIIKKDEWLLNDTDLYKGNFTGYLDDLSPYTAEQYSIAYNNARNLSLALQYAVDKGYKKIRLETGKYALPTVYSIIVTEMKNVEIDLGGSTLYTIKEAYRTFSQVISNTAVNKDTGFTNALYEGGTMFVVSNSSNSVIRNATFIGDRNYLDWRKKRASSAVVNAALGDPGNTVGILLHGDKLRVENITFREIRGEGVWTGINENRQRINAPKLEDGSYDYKNSISQEVLTSAPKNSNGYYFIGKSQILDFTNYTQPVSGELPDTSKLDLIYPGIRKSLTVNDNFKQDIRNNERKGVNVINYEEVVNNLSTISDLLDIESYRKKLELKADKTLLEKLDKGIFEIYSWGHYTYKVKQDGKEIQKDAFGYIRSPYASQQNLIILTYQSEDDDSTHTLENYTRAIKTSVGQQFQLNPWEKYIRIITLNDYYVNSGGSFVYGKNSNFKVSITIALNNEHQISNCEFINCFRGGIGIGSHNVTINNCRFLKDDAINKTESVSESIYFKDDMSATTYSNPSNAMITTEGFQACGLKILNSYFNASNAQSMLIIQGHDVQFNNCITKNVTFALYATKDIDITSCTINGYSYQEFMQIDYKDDYYNKEHIEKTPMVKNINIYNNTIMCNCNMFRFFNHNNCFVNVCNNKFYIISAAKPINDIDFDSGIWKNNLFSNNTIIIRRKCTLNGDTNHISGYNYAYLNAYCYNNTFIGNNGLFEIIAPKFENNIYSKYIALTPSNLKTSISNLSSNSVVNINDSQIVRSFLDPRVNSSLGAKQIIFNNCVIDYLTFGTFCNHRPKIDYALPTLIFKNCKFKYSIRLRYFGAPDPSPFTFNIKFFRCNFEEMSDTVLLIFDTNNEYSSTLGVGTDRDTIEYDYSMPEIKLTNRNFSSVMNTSTIIGSKSGTSFPSFPYEGMQFYKTDVNVYYTYANGEWKSINDSVSSVEIDSLF